MKTLFTFLCLVAMGTYATAQTVYYQEDLEGGLPDDWEITMVDGLSVMLLLYQARTLVCQILEKVKWLALTMMV